MYRQEILRALNSDSNIYTTKILKQHWKESRYSYLTVPRPDFGLLLLLKGSVDFVTEFGTLSVHAGTLVFLPKNCRYEAVFLNEADDYLVSFEICPSDLSVPTPIKLFETASFSCVERFQALVEEHFSEKHTKLNSKGLFYLLLDAIVNDTEAETNATNALVNRVRGLLGRSEDISIGDIAKECAVSESGLRRIFKERVGLTPIQYKIKLKLKQAMYLLESTDLSVNEIAEQLNFFDAAYFCKVFRLHTGMTPKQYSQNKKL